MPVLCESTCLFTIPPTSPIGTGMGRCHHHQQHCRRWRFWGETVTARLGIVAENYYSGYYSQSITLPQRHSHTHTHIHTQTHTQTHKQGDCKTASDILTGTTIYPCIAHNDNYNGSHNYECLAINNAKPALTTDGC